MRQLPNAIPELDGGLFLPRPVVDLLEAVLAQHEQALRRHPPDELACGDSVDLRALGELRHLLRMSGQRPVLPAPRDQLGLCDPRERLVARNLLRG